VIDSDRVILGINQLTAQNLLL